MKRWGTLTPALLGLGLILCSGRAALADWRLPMSESMQYRTFDEHIRDVRFVEQAASGGMAEVELGELAMKQGSSEAVREYARHIVEEHRQANKELATYATQNQIDMRAKIDSSHKRTHERLSGLSGSEFDRAYLAEQIKSHRKSIELYEDQADLGHDGDLRLWASKMLPTLRSHLRQARTLSEGRAPSTSSSAR